VCGGTYPKSSASPALCSGAGAEFSAFMAKVGDKGRGGVGWGGVDPPKVTRRKRTDNQMGALERLGPALAGLACLVPPWLGVPKTVTEPTTLLLPITVNHSIETQQTVWQNWN
jgi:hypothetical protein